MNVTCIDCKCFPWIIGEDFYINNILWKRVVPENGIICIGCFEKRMGRQLLKTDFKPWFRKNRCFGNRRRKLNRYPSQRLVERLELSNTHDPKDYEISHPISKQNKAING